MDDLISEFITETSESLAVLDLELVKLEQNPNDKAILGNIFRLVHTIKGTCGFLGLPRLETVAHAAENVLGKIRDNEIEVTPAAISVVLEALDTIKHIMDHLAQNGQEPEGDDSDLKARLNEAAQGSAPSAAAKPAPAPEPVLEVMPAHKPQEKQEGLTQEELDALERAFNEAQPTVQGGVPDPAVALAKIEAEQTNLPAKPSAKDLTQKAKDSAIQAGLAADPKEAGGMAGQSIRVNLDVLENLMQMVGELVLTRNQLLQIARNREDADFKGPLQQLSHITTELQEGIMKTRMQPIGNAWAKFPRLVRDLSLELGKKIELRMEGAETELDRQLLEMIKDPLTHMVRNSCDHGLEKPEDRYASGKDESGTVTLSAYHEGGHIIIQISDDGRGINVERVKQKAISNGIASEYELAQMTDQQIMQFIFKAGFSTAEKVTSVSGRGVGMDVVRTNIEKIGGTIELSSEMGMGSTFHIKIPLTLAIVSVLIVDSGGEKFAIPQINVLELVRTASDSDYRIEMISRAPVLRLRGKLLPLVRLTEVLQLPEVERTEDELLFGDAEEEFIVVCNVGGAHFGLIVDRIFDTEEIVVKPVSMLLQHVPVYSGNTILGDGSVIMILDPNGLARCAGQQDMGRGDEDDLKAKRSSHDRLVSFLLFRAGEGAPKAVPLELVSRLEEVDVAKIELSGGDPVIQYRGDLMRLTTLHGGHIPGQGITDVIVFTYDNKTVGLVVDEILDITEAPLSVKLVSKDDAYLGSLVIGGKTTDVVDVGYLLKDLASDMSALRSDVAADGTDNRLLLVEDSMFFRNLTVPFLTEVGYKVTAAASGTEAMERLRSEVFDVIVTDIEMPEMDGFQLTERLRGNPRYDHIPIIAFTSTVNQQFIARSHEVGMNDIILKTDRENLVHAISHHLAVAQRRGAA